jgi:hypothetical protein
MTGPRTRSAQSDGPLSRAGKSLKARRSARIEGRESGGKLMHTATTPTRRTMKQPTLQEMGMSPTTVTPVSASVGGDAKRTTRGSAAAQQTSPATTTTTGEAATPPRTRTRTPRSRALQFTRTPQLRPRQAPTSGGGLREPYEKHTTDALREECVRRGLSIQTREQGGGAKVAVVRSKAKFIQLLQEADMLAMFERQSQKKMGSRAARAVARAVKLTPPPAPIRVVSTVSPTSHHADPVAETASLAESSSAATEKAPAKTMTTKNAPRSRPKKKAAPPAATTNALAAEVATVQPPAAQPVGTIDASVAVATTLQLPGANEASSSNATSPIAAPSLAAAPPLQLPASEVCATEEEDKQALPATEATEQRNMQPDTVDLTGDAPTGTPAVQPLTPLVEFAQAAQAPPKLQQPTKIATALKTQEARHAPSSTQSTAHSAVRPSSAPAIRARRGCRFRLINVVLSPDFNTRWSEMNTPVVSRTDVNTFWRDVHISFLCQNSFYDKVHFEDALFENVTPNVIQSHSAQKLQQMWTEIIATYRRSHNASMKEVESKPFLDFCAGRLDLLYLHMALLLEPELHTLVLNETPRLKVIGAIVQGSSGTTKAAKSGSRDQSRTSADRGEERLPEGLNANSYMDHAPRYVELQNPEMLPNWLLEDRAKAAAERNADFDVFDGEQPYSQVQQTAFSAAPDVTPKANKRAASKRKKRDSAVSRSPDVDPLAAHASPVQTRDMVLHSSAINSIDDSASSDYESVEPSVPSGSASRRRAPGKRRRETPATELVELATSRELVPHAHKRMHTAVTTTMTRSQETLLPPDEFEIQHNRLRKINESIDQCYRTLSNSDAILNDMHREDIESDLRFYLGIKKRIQEQIVMFMHGF